jgi:hypothetical protein
MCWREGRGAKRGGWVIVDGILAITEIDEPCDDIDDA